MSKVAPFTVSDVLTLATARVARDGLDALTLRPLAEDLGASVSVLTYRFGSKPELIAHLVAAAREQDQAFYARWLRRLPQDRTLSSLDLADLIDSILEDLTHAHRHRMLFLCELLQASAWQEGLWRTVSPWIEDRLRFWRALMDRLATPPPFDLAAFVHAYAIDEGAHSLALGDLTAYRWLRKLGLKRLCGGIVAEPPRSADLQLFHAFYRELGELPGENAVEHNIARLTDRQVEIAQHAGQLIVAGGADAVTHRAVAERARIPSSTLAYHFRRQEDLLMAGLEAIIHQLAQDVDAALNMPETPNRFARSEPNARNSAEIGRATFAVALAATRLPSLVACSADMRRRRGENVYRVLRSNPLVPTGFDELAAQAIAIAGIGQALLSGHKGGAAAHSDGIETISALWQACLSPAAER